MKRFVLLSLILIFVNGMEFAVASTFNFSITTPGETDISLNQALMTAIQYHNVNNTTKDSISFENDDFTYVANFIAMESGASRTTAWAISLIDTATEARPEKCFMSFVIIESPSGNILYYSDQNYWNVFHGEWMPLFQESGRTRAEVRALFDSLVLPEHIMDRACFPEDGFLTEQDAYEIACVAITEFANKPISEIYPLSTSELITLPMIIDHPVWIIRLQGFYGADSKDNMSNYVVAISPIDGDIWFIFESKTKSFLEVNHSFCIEGVDIDELPQLGLPFIWSEILP